MLFVLVSPQYIKQGRARRSSSLPPPTTPGRCSPRGVSSVPHSSAADNSISPIPFLSPPPQDDHEAVEWGAVSMLSFDGGDATGGAAGVGRGREASTAPAPPSSGHVLEEGARKKAMRRVEAVKERLRTAGRQPRSASAEPSPRRRLAGLAASGRLDPQAEAAGAATTVSSSSPSSSRVLLDSINRSMNSLQANLSISKLAGEMAECTKTDVVHAARALQERTGSEPNGDWQEGSNGAGTKEKTFNGAEPRRPQEAWGAHRGAEGAADNGGTSTPGEAGGQSLFQYPPEVLQLIRKRQSLKAKWAAKAAFPASFGATGGRRRSISGALGTPSKASATELPAQQAPGRTRRSSFSGRTPSLATAMPEKARPAPGNAAGKATRGKAQYEARTKPSPKKPLPLSALANRAMTRTAAASTATAPRSRAGKRNSSRPWRDVKPKVPLRSVSAARPARKPRSSSTATGSRPGTARRPSGANGGGRSQSVTRRESAAKQGDTTAVRRRRHSLAHGSRAASSPPGDDNGFGVAATAMATPQPAAAPPTAHSRFSPAGALQFSSEPLPHDGATLPAGAVADSAATDNTPVYITLPVPGPDNERVFRTFVYMVPGGKQGASAQVMWAKQQQQQEEGPPPAIAIPQTSPHRHSPQHQLQGLASPAHVKALLFTSPTHTRASARPASSFSSTKRSTSASRAAASPSTRSGSRPRPAASPSPRPSPSKLHDLNAKFNSARKRVAARQAKALQAAVTRRARASIKEQERAGTGVLGPAVYSRHKTKIPPHSTNAGSYVQSMRP